jgi:hypothetical protein
MVGDLLYSNLTFILAECSDERIALQWAMRGAAVVSLIGSLEWLYIRTSSAEGLYAIDIMRHRSRSAQRGALSLYPPLVSILLAQILLSVVLLLPGQNTMFQGVICCLIALCYLLLSVRGIDGFSGGDALAKIIFLSIGLAYTSCSSIIEKMTVAFLASQLLISYLTPGLCRIIDLEWLSGQKMLGVMRTHSYGRYSVWSLLREKPNFARSVSTAIAVWEAGFVLYLFLPMPVLIFALCIGVVFHTTNALVMGLNVFPWSFLAAYPSLVWTWNYLRSG